MSFYLAGWKNRQNVNIPPVKSKGFSHEIIIRKHIEPKRTIQNIQNLYELDDKTVILQDSKRYFDEDATVLLNEKRIVLTVIRMKTGEEKEIMGNAFVLGKANDCDYVITGNPTISRHHVKIKRENGDYILEDLKSANHTYVDNCELTEPVRVMKDMVFRMSDEDFKISVEIK